MEAAAWTSAAAAMTTGAIPDSSMRCAKAPLTYHVAGLFHVSTAAEKLQQRPQKLEESDDEFPDALELIPACDARDGMQDHAM